MVNQIKKKMTAMKARLVRLGDFTQVTWLIWI